MNPKPLFVTAGAVTVLIAIVIGWRAAQSARMAEAERVALLAARTGQDTTNRRLEDRLAAATRDRADLQVAIAQVRAPNKTAAAVPTPPTPAKIQGPGSVNPMELIAKDPKLQLLMLASVRAEFATTYGPFIVSRGLTPEQVQKLTDAKIKSQEEAQDLIAVMREQKLPPNDPGIAGLRKRAEDELRATQTEVLGAALYEQLQGYERTLPMRAMVERFAGAAAIGDVPLNAQQAEQLTQIMAGAIAGPQRGGRIDATQIDWSAVDEKAKDVLSPAQLSLFQRIEPVGGGASRWMAQFQRAMQEASGPAAPRPGG